MAAGDKLWFELGVRDEISSVLENLMRNSEKLGNALSNDTAELKNYYRNIVDISNVYDKINVAQKRINDLRGTSLSKDEKKGLKDIEKELENTRKEFAKMFNDPDKLLSKGTAAFDKMRTNIELMVKATLRYVDNIEKKDAAEEQNAVNEERRIDNLKAKYYELQRQRQNLANSIANAAPGADLTDANSLLAGITSRMGAVKRAQANGGSMPASLVGADAEEFFRKVKEEIASLNNQTKEYNATLESHRATYNKLKKIYLDTQNEQVIANIKGQRAEYVALGQKLQDVGRLMSAVAAEEPIAKGGGKVTHTAEVIQERLDEINRRYNKTLAERREAEKQTSRTTKDSAEASRIAAEAVRNMATANQGLLNTFKELDKAGKNTNKMLDQMASTFGMMFSFYGMKRLIQQVVTIGGQFEFQHVALQNILGDIQQANVLFAQLQGLAVESPKTFMELTSYAKQLSAYQIPASELYDTTKRLADLSTGLGVDMGRLILAYGQVRSAAVLRGQELRQFTEAGIPMVQKLADKFTELNGKLTTTGDVFKLISARKVPFEMVQEVLWDMTNQGGQFYNMQSELADTLYGKWQKLQDTWQIMLGHIADGKSAMGGFLRMILDLTVAITRSLDIMVPMLAGIGMSRLIKSNKNFIQTNWSKVVDSQDSSAITQMRLAKEKQANRLMQERLQFSRQLTAQEWEIVRTKNILTSNDYMMLAYEGRISEYKAAQLALDGKINTLEAYRLFLAKGYTKEQIRQMRNGDLSMLQQEKMGLKDLWKNGGIAGVIMGGGKNLFGGIKNLLGGWLGVIITLGGIVHSIYSGIESGNEEIASRSESMMSSAQQNANSLASSLTQVANSSDTVSKKIEVLENSLLNMGEEGKRIIRDSRDIEDISKRFEKLIELSEAYKNTLEGIGTPTGKTLHEQAIKDSDIEDDVKSFEDLRNVEFKLTGQMSKFSDKYARMIDSMKTKHKELSEQLTSSNLFENLRKLMTGEYAGEAVTYYAGPAREALQEYYTAIQKSEKAFKNIQTETIPKVMDSLRAEAMHVGVDLTKPFEKLTDVEKEALRTVATNFANSLDNASQDTKNDIANWVAQGFYAKLYITPVVGKVFTGFAKQLADWQSLSPNGVKLWSDQEMQNASNDILEFDKMNSKRYEELISNIDKYTNSLKTATGVRKEALQSNLDADKKEKEALEKAKEEGLWNYTPTKGKGNSGSKKDTELERIKNRVDLYKKFFSELESARKIYGTGAEKYLRENGFASVFSTGEGGWNLSNVSDYKKSLDELTKGLNDNSEARHKFLNDVDADKVVQQRKKDADAIKDTVNELQRMLNIMSENYQVYKKWLDLTGDASLAARVAGVIQNTSYSDYLTDLMKKQLDKTNLALSASDVFGLNESDAKKLGEDNAIFKLWEEWQKNQQKLKKEQWDLYEEAYKGAKNYDDKIADVNRKLNEQITAIEKLAQTDEERNYLTKNARKNAEQEIGSLRWEKFKQENNWGEIFGDLENVSLKKLRKLIKAMQTLQNTTRLNVNEARAWQEAMDKALTTEASKDSLGSISTAITNYKDAKKILSQLETKAEGVRRGYYRDEFKDEEEFENALRQAEDNIQNALSALMKALKAFSKDLNNLSKTFEQIGNNIGGSIGDVLGGIGSIFGGIGSSIEALSSIDINAKGLTAVIGKLNAVATVFNAMVDMNKKLDSILPNSESMYEHYAEKAREVNKLREAVDDYRIAVADAQAQESEWFSGNNLSKLRANGEKAKETLTAYFSEMYEAQEAYQDKRSGLSKYGGAIAGAVVGAVVTALTWGTGGPLGVALGTTIATAVGGTAATAIGAIVATGIGTAVGNIAQRAAETILYKDGQIDARSNMRIQTRHRSFWRSEKTENLEEWVRDTLNAELFDKEGLVNLEAAQEVLDKYGDKLVGDTKETLEKLVKLRQEYDEFIKQIEDYVGEIGTSLAENMTNALWDWLSNGENALDKFKEYASDTWKSIAQDIVKTFMKVAVLDKYAETFKQMFKNWSLGELSDENLIAGVAALSGLIADDFETSLPLAERIAQLLNTSFAERGYDITNNNGNSSSARSSIEGVTENTADLLASYLNAIRLDVSVNRNTLSEILIAVQSQSDMPVIARAQLQQLQLIVQHTSKTAENTARISDLYDLIKANTLGGNKFNI